MAQRLHIDRRTVTYAHDLLMAASSYLLALYLRLGEAIGDLPNTVLWKGLVLFVVICAMPR
jgi:hypothetical protein